MTRTHASDSDEHPSDDGVGAHNEPTVVQSPMSAEETPTVVSDQTTEGEPPSDEATRVEDGSTTVLGPQSLDPDNTASFEVGDASGQSRTHPDKGGMDTRVEGLLASETAASDQPDIGDYQLLGELGRGGMGVVYKAKHRKLNRIVALKMILGGQHANQAALARFIKEAQAVAHLQHPSIVQIFDIGEHNGLPYFSLEYVEGTDLKQKLDAQPQDATFAAKLVETLAIAMQYAHDNNILHRDLKPSNVLLAENGEPKITDFGLAKQVDGEAASTGTSDGTIMGSPSYMPPEQARGEVSSLSPRSDLYSLGAILYEMLTGRPPFIAKKPLETVMQVVNNEPVAPREFQPDLPVEIETICLKAMQKEPGSRYETCHELAADLRRFLNGEPILARPVGRIERLMKWCRRNPKIALPSGLALSAIVLTAIIATWAWQTTSAQAAVIAQERDNVKEQRDEAKKQTKIAEENRTAAEAQALVALQSIQFVVDKVDSELRGKAQLNDVRIKLMDAVSEKWEEIDIDRTGGEQGEAIPTLMALKFNVANAFVELDQIEKAHRAYAKLEEMARQRIEVKGLNDATRDNLARVLTAWAVIRKRVDGEDQNVTIPMLTEAIKLIDDAFASRAPVQNSPSTSELRETRAAASQNLGTEYLYQGNLEAAAKAFQRSLDDNGQNLKEIREAPGFDKFTEDQKDTATALKQLEYDRAAISLAYIQLRRGETKAALKLYDQAIAGRREIYTRRPNVPLLSDSLAGFLSLYGQAHLWLNKPDKATPMLTEAVTIEKAAYENDPKVARKGRAAATTYYRIAVAHDLLKQEEEAKAALQSCHDIRTKLVAKSDDIKNRVSLMLVDARLGNVPSATKTANEILADEASSTEHNLDAARAFAQISRHISDNGKKSVVIENAIKALQRCVKQGYSEPFRIHHDNDLSPLHGHQRFKALLTEVSRQK